MTHIAPATLSDRALLDATVGGADREHRATADLVALLAELDARELYLGLGYPSLFAYCTQVLHLSEPAAYSRIAAARAARRFPAILALLAGGDVTLTAVCLLVAHLTDENHEALLDAVRHKSKRDVERLIACLYPQPDIPSSVRKMSASDAPRLSLADEPASTTSTTTPAEPRDLESPRTVSPLATPRRAVVAPLGAERYLLKVTLTREGHDKLERARALLRHVIPNGDPAAVVDRALTALLEQLEKKRLAATSRPRDHVRPTAYHRTRHVPAAVRRAVWVRDEGRCAFVGSHGRCGETGFLEIHHVQPFADGGATCIENLQLRCRPHNAYEAECYFRRLEGESSAPEERG